MEEGIEEDICSYTNEEGLERSRCRDTPITYCKNCKRFYVVDEEGNREEILIKVLED